MASQETEFTWNDAFLLGYGPMDDTHRDFVKCVEAALGASASEFVAALHDLVAHLERHFAEEKQWMEASGFPATDCHVDEHAAVLHSAHEVVDLLSEGQHIGVGRSFALELARWFPQHADYMDSALAHWIAKRAHGGIPVVLRRNAAFTTQ